MYSEGAIREAMTKHVLPEFTRYVKSKHKICNHHELSGALFTSIRRYLPTLSKDKHGTYGCFSQNNFSVINVTPNGIIDQMEFDTVGSGGYNGLTKEGVDLMNDIVSKFNFEEEHMGIEFDGIIQSIDQFSVRQPVTY